MSKQALVWIDHKEARICEARLGTIDKSAIWSPTHHLHRELRPPGGEAANADESRAFFHDLDRLLSGMDEVLIVGPATGKVQFMAYLHEHDRALLPRIVAVETVEHPSDERVLGFARKYFVDGGDDTIRVVA